MCRGERLRGHAKDPSSASISDHLSLRPSTDHDLGDGVVGERDPGPADQGQRQGHDGGESLIKRFHITEQFDDPITGASGGFVHLFPMIRLIRLPVL